MSETLKVLGISGSLRAESYNTALLREAGAILGERVHFSIAEIGDLPLYSDDLGEPGPVDRLKREIAAADAVIIASPEYNHGIPGPLKNAIDWASRPAFRSPFAGKPVAIMGVAKNTIGTARMQVHLREVLFGMLARVFVSREIVVGSATQRFEEGRLTDESTRNYIASFLDAFLDEVSARR